MQMTKGIYIGNPNSKRQKSLKGQTALLRESPRKGFVLAQFDDRGTGLGYGWHEFSEHKFKPVEEPKS